MTLISLSTLFPDSCKTCRWPPCLPVTRSKTFPLFSEPASKGRTPTPPTAKFLVFLSHEWLTEVRTLLPWKWLDTEINISAHLADWKFSWLQINPNYKSSHLPFMWKSKAQPPFLHTLIFISPYCNALNKIHFLVPSPFVLDKQENFLAFWLEEGQWRYKQGFPKRCRLADIRPFVSWQSLLTSGTGFPGMPLNPSFKISFGALEGPLPTLELRGGFFDTSSAVNSQSALSEAISLNPLLATQNMLAGNSSRLQKRTLPNQKAKTEFDTIKLRNSPPLET